MKLNRGRGALFCDDLLTLSRILLDVIGQMLGNRSAVEWVIERYRCFGASTTLWHPND